MWNTIFHLINEYMGTGFVMIWYLIMLVYLWKVEGRLERRILFLYMPLVILVLFFNPILAKLFYRFADEETYYRLLWLLPVTITIAYGCTRIVTGLEGKKQGLVAILFALLIMGSGSLIYSDSNMKKAENIYHMPQAVVDICDDIVIEGREIMVAFPPEMVQFVRQYTPLIWQPYGRENLVDRWNAPNEVADAISSEVIDAAVFAHMARYHDCHYIVLPEDKPVDGSLEENGFPLYKNIDGYNIYRNEVANFDPVVK